MLLLNKIINLRKYISNANSLKLKEVYINYFIIDIFHKN
jgi:hypothetical protein